MEYVHASDLAYQRGSCRSVCATGRGGVRYAYRGKPVGSVAEPVAGFLVALDEDKHLAMDFWAVMGKMGGGRAPLISLVNP